MSWQLQHQAINVFVDLLKRKIHGANSSSQVIGINARQFSVSRVLVNDVEAKFSFVALHDILVPEDQKELRELATLEAYRTKAFAEAQKSGELRVEVPPEFGVVQDVIVQVHFSLTEPTGGAIFRWPKGDEKAPHMYLQTRFGEACCVFPCIDSPAARCVFDLSISTDAALTVVASGVMDPFPKSDGVFTTRSFKTSGSCSAREVFFAVGPFEAYVDPRLPKVTHYCMAGQQALLAQTVSVTPDIIKFFESSLQLPVMPVASFSTLFLADVMVSNTPFHCGALLSDFLLFPRQAIDMLTKTTHELAIALAEQWVNAYVRVDEWSEMWLVQGLTQLLAHLFMINFEKPNNARWRLLSLTDEFLSLPPETIARPLYVKEPGHAADLFLPFVHKKALLVLAMVQRRVNETMFKEVIKVLFDKPSVYSTHSFLEKVALASHHVMDDIESSWVRRGGYLSISCGFSWNQKRHYLEFALKQDFGVARFTGLLPVRVHEIDGPFMHEIVLSDVKPYAWDDFPVHARPPQKKKKRAKKGETAAANDGAATAATAIAETPAAAAATPGSDSKSGIKFHPAAAGEGEEAEVCPIVFLRVDPDGQWIMKAVFYQPEEFWMNQLDTSLDVVAEREAVRGLSSFKTVTAIDRLSEILNDPAKFWGVRVEAVSSLAQLAGPETDWRAANAIVSSYKEAFYRSDAPLPKQNDFSDLSQYLVAKAMLTAMSTMFDSQTKTTFLKGAAVIIDVLQHNDNSLNIYSDHSFLRVALEAAGRLKLIPGSTEHTQLTAQLDRYARLSDTINYYHMDVKVGMLNCMTTRLLESPAGSSASNELQYFRKHLFKTTLPWNVRLAAGDGLFRAVLKRGSEEEAEGVLFELVGLAENPREAPALRLRLLEAAAAAARAHNVSKQFAEAGDSEGKLFCSARHVRLAERLWALVSGPALAHCAVLRGAATVLYSALWGLETPPQLGPPPAHLLRASASVALQDAPTAAMARTSRDDQLGSWRDVVGHLVDQTAKPPSSAQPAASSANKLSASASKLKLKISSAPEATASEPEQKKVKFEGDKEEE